MAEIVNLKRVKKGRNRAEAERLAAENRVRHGLTKAAKQALRAEQAQDKARLEGRKLDGGAAKPREEGE